MLKWHTLQSLSKIGIWILSMTKRGHLQDVWKTKSCNYPRRLARYLYFLFFSSFFTFATAVICPKPNNTRPYNQITTEHSVWAISYEYLTHREKANLDEQEVHDITHFVSAVSIPWFMGTQDLLFSLESINLYYFNIIKKYTSHM